jgi:DNA-binding response OmpR family regulator
MKSQVARSIPARPATQPGEEIHPDAIQLLVVDDDEFLREMLGEHLWRAGYDVRVAEDAIAAGRQILKNPPDIMVVDASMPYMDGFEFVAAVRADRTIPHIPVIFLGAHRAAVTRAREFGAICLLKPVQSERLLAAVASLRWARPSADGKYRRVVAGALHENRDSLDGKNSRL